MKKSVLVIGMVIVGVGIGFAMGKKPYQEPLVIPKINQNSLVISDKTIDSLNITTLTGETVTKASLEGKIVVMDFWATWCPPCVASIPVFNALHADNDDVVVIAVSVDQDPSVVPAFIQKNDIDYRVALSNRQLNNAVGGIQGIPTAVIFGRDGKLIKKAVGYHEKAFFDAIIAEH